MGLDPTIDEFESAKDPDKEFIDSMIPHHAGAIAMANDLLKHGKNPELRAMAEAIIVAQHSEILKLQRATKFVPTKPENYKGIEEAARSAGLLK